MWSPQTGAQDREVYIVITTLPDNGGSPISSLEWAISGSGTWSALPGSTVGTYTVLLPAEDTEYTVLVRARNIQGAGPASNQVAVTSGLTPTAASIPISRVEFTAPDQLDVDYTDSSPSMTMFAVTSTASTLGKVAIETATGTGTIEGFTADAGTGTVSITGLTYLSNDATYIHFFLRNALNEESDVQSISVSGLNVGSAPSGPLYEEDFSSGDGGWEIHAVDAAFDPQIVHDATEEDLIVTIGNPWTGSGSPTITSPTGGTHEVTLTFSDWGGPSQGEVGVRDASFGGLSWGGSATGDRVSASKSFPYTVTFNIEVVANTPFRIVPRYRGGAAGNQFRVTYCKVEAV